MRKASLLILDGRHLLYRTADVFRTLSVETSEGEESIGGVYGFLATALRVWQKWGGITVVAWEGESNYRRDLYPEYKAKGEPDEEQRMFLEELDGQEARLWVLLSLMGVRQYTCHGGEADDVMATLAERMAGKGPIIIYTGDSDLRQMVDDERDIRVVAPGRKGKDKVYDEAAVLEKHHCTPRNLPASKALAGDSSDNIPGISGIGPVKAGALLDTYGSLAEIVSAASSGDDRWPVGERFRETLAAASKELYLYLRLTMVKRDIQMIPAIKPQRDKKQVIEQFRHYKFRTLLGPAELMGLMRMGNG